MARKNQAADGETKKLRQVPEAEVEELIVLGEKLRTIEDDDQMEAAGELVRDKIEPMLKVIDSVFNPIIEAQMEVGRKQRLALREARDQLEIARKPMERLRTAIRRAVADYDERRKTAQRRLAAKAHERAMAAAPKPAPGQVTRPAPVTTPSPISKGAAAPKLGTRKHWKFEILDAEKVAPAFLVPDTVKMGKTLRAMGDDALAVLGGAEAVRIWQEIS